jgi:hypothetical protein
METGPFLTMQGLLFLTLGAMHKAFGCHVHGIYIENKSSNEEMMRHLQKKKDPQCTVFSFMSKSSAINVIPFPTS